MRKRALLVILLVTAALWSWPQYNPAEAQEKLVMEVQAGFDGYYKQGSWTPFQVTIANEGSDVEGQVRILSQDGAAQTAYVKSVSLPSHSRKRFFLYLPIAGYRRQVAVDLLEGQKVIAKEVLNLQSLQSHDYLCGVVSSAPSLLNFLSGLKLGSQGQVAIAHLRLEDIPPQGQALDALDALIINSTDTSRLEEKQRQALRAWVTFGGHLVVTGGPNWQLTVGGLADLLPVTVTGSQSLSDLSALESFAGEAIQGSGPFLVSTVAVADGRVLLSQEQVPLLVRGNVGQGRVDYLTLDLTLEPLNAWVGNDTLWNKILTPAQAFSWHKRSNRNWSAMAYALAEIAGPDLPSSTQLAFFLLLYVICIGPLNYLVLRRLDRREWAWLTIPLVILIFSGGAYVTGFQARGGTTLNQLSITYVQLDDHADDDAATMAAVDSFVGLFSPRRHSYEIEIGHTALVSQLGLDYGWGGGGSPATVEIEGGNPTVVRNVRVDVGAIQGFRVEMHQPFPSLKSSLRLESSSSNPRLVGQIVNQGGDKIEDCVLLAGGRVIQLPDLEPGTPKEVDVLLDSLAFAQRPLSHQIVGVPSYYEPGGRRESVRRKAAFDVVSGSGNYSSSDFYSGLYLLGWQTESPVPIGVKAGHVSTRQTTLLIAALPVAFERGKIVVPSGFLSWRVLENKAGAFQAKPYGIYLNAGSVILRFELPQGAKDLGVEGLTFYLEGTRTGAAGKGQPLPEVSLYNWPKDRWIQLAQLQAGANPIVGDPGVYVSPAGYIDVRLKGGTPYQITRLDFAVEGRR
jgi:hypothetical protein